MRLPMSCPTLLKVKMLWRWLMQKPQRQAHLAAALLAKYTTSFIFKHFLMFQDAIEGAKAEATAAGTFGSSNPC